MKIGARDAVKAGNQLYIVIGQRIGAVITAVQNQKQTVQVQLAIVRSAPGAGKEIILRIGHVPQVLFPQLPLGIIIGDKAHKGVGIAVYRPG